MPPILKEFPSQFESNRLLIRSPRPGDGDMIRQAVLESVESLKPWMPWAVDIPSAEKYEAMVREWHLDFLHRKDLIMFLFDKESDKVVGGSGLHRIDWTVPKFEIGYWVRTKFARQGFITESTQAITQFAFDELGAKRVEIRCDAQNHRSAAIPKRLGFPLEAVLKCHARNHLTNELRDTLVFAKTRP